VSKGLNEAHRHQMEFTDFHGLLQILSVVLYYSQTPSKSYQGPQSKEIFVSVSFTASRVMTIFEKFDYPTSQEIAKTLLL
jgi:hypothetical protein